MWTAEHRERYKDDDQRGARIDSFYATTPIPSRSQTMRT
jgi:hypothetical protein